MHTPGSSPNKKKSQPMSHPGQEILGMHLIDVAFAQWPSFQKGNKYSAVDVERFKR